MRQKSGLMGLLQRFPFHRRLTITAVLFFLVAVATVGARAQTCNDWKAVTGWQGTYTLTSNGQFIHGMIDQYTINETSGATVNMNSQTGGLCNQIRWQGPDLNNTGSVNDNTQVLNGCVQGQWFTSDTLVGNAGFPSNSEIVVDATDGTFSFQPIPSDSVLHTVYNCEGSQSQQIQWGTGPGNNWPLNFTLPSQVGPLTVNSFPFSASSLYAGYQDINWTITFNLTPVLPGYQPLTVAVTGNGSVASTDGFINCPSVCTHSYPPDAQVTLNATPGQGSTFVGWSGACSGTGSCTVTMSQAQTVNAIFSPPLQFVAVEPCRVADTRNPNGTFGGPPLQGRTQRSFPIAQSACNIPASAQAYSLNITVVPSGSLGYLTAWPTGENQPLVSTMNSPDGRIKANAAIIPAGTNSGVSFYATDTTNLVVDVNGYFTPATGSPGVLLDQFYALPPCRAIDTRIGLGGSYLQGGVARMLSPQSSNCIPGGLTIHAYSFNATVIPHPAGQSLAYLTLWPYSSPQPLVSTLNNLTATLVANAAIVPTVNDDIMAYASNDTDLVLDINGYFAAPGPGGLSLYPTMPCRVLDTRDHNGQPFTGEKTVSVIGSPCAPPVGAQAYVFNATVVPSGSLGYLTLWPDGQLKPLVSTLNATDGFITSNMAVVPTTNGSIDAYASGLTQLVLDISGYFAP